MTESLRFCVRVLPKADGTVLDAGPGQWFRGMVRGDELQIAHSHRGPDILEPTSPAQEAWMRDHMGGIGSETWYCTWTLGPGGRAAFERLISPASTVVSLDDHERFARLTMLSRWDDAHARRISDEGTALLDRYDDWWDLVRVRALADERSGHVDRARAAFEAILAREPGDSAIAAALRLLSERPADG